MSCSASSMINSTLAMPWSITARVGIKLSGHNTIARITLNTYSLEHVLIKEDQLVSTAVFSCVLTSTIYSSNKMQVYTVLPSSLGIIFGLPSDPDSSESLPPRTLLFRRPEAMGTDDRDSRTCTSLSSIAAW